MSISGDLGKTSFEETSLDYLETNEVQSAFATTITYMIADAFQLESEEISWFNYKIKELICEFTLIKNASLPNSVSHELKTNHYSQNLSSLVGDTRDKSDMQELVNANDWLDVIMDMLKETFDINPIALAKTRATMGEALRKLGIGEKSNPRNALYLPNAIRYMVSRRDAVKVTA